MLYYSPKYEKYEKQEKKMKEKRSYRAEGKLFRAEMLCVAALVIAAAVMVGAGLAAIWTPVEGFALIGTEEFVLQSAEEDEDVGVLAAVYASGALELETEYPPESEAAERVTGWVYSDGETSVAFDHEASADEVASAVRDIRANDNMTRFGWAMALGLVAIGLAVVAFYDRFFTTYEKIWYLSILVLAALFSILFPEEDCNGVSGILIMALYLADTILNITCELLISKQSKWNFIVSVFVEITEIAICLVLAYRFATMASTLFFWLPIDIISFINWNKHPDQQEEELTEVRRLRGWQEVLILVGIAVWTAGIGYLLTAMDLGTDLFHGNELLYVITCYIDACASAVGIANGLFILFRFREQWVAWYISALLEAAINILSGQYVLLILKLGYITNTTYGYIKWTQYIKSHKEHKSIL